jgi:hypothetical protein
MEEVVGFDPGWLYVGSELHSWGREGHRRTPRRERMDGESSACVPPRFEQGVGPAVIPPLFPPGLPASALTKPSTGDRNMMTDNQIVEGDCLTILKQLPDASVDLVITDPPYLGRYKDRLGLGGLDAGWPSRFMRHGAVCEQLFAAAQHNWHRKDAHRVGKVVGQQRMHEVGTALGD